VRQVVSEIRKCHDAILIIANKLTNDISISEKEKSSAIKIEKKDS
jgi:hypothetical protein